ncbi:MAG TPA: hypothetical protein VHN78_15135, partial [Chloroflexota bacterium]|nr:hypothetical protein [Chloroflexota bacterium]
PATTTTTSGVRPTTTTVLPGPGPIDRGPLTRTGSDAGGLLLLGGLALVLGGALVLSSPRGVARRGVRRPPW